MCAKTNDYFYNCSSQTGKSLVQNLQETAIPDIKRKRLAMQAIAEQLTEAWSGIDGATCAAKLKAASGVAQTVENGLTTVGNRLSLCVAALEDYGEKCTEIESKWGRAVDVAITMQ